MIQELDVYVLLKRATAISLKECAAKWTKGLDTPSEYVARLADGSFMDFDNINNFLVHVLGGNASAVLYWTGEGSTAKHRPEMDSLFMFFNEDGSVIIGVGVRFEPACKSLNYVQILPYFKELVVDLDVLAGYTTMGTPADSRRDFLSIAKNSTAPKVWNGVVIED